MKLKEPVLTKRIPTWPWGNSSERAFVDIDAYKNSGGYQALQTALEMEPEKMFLGDEIVPWGKHNYKAGHHVLGLRERADVILLTTKFLVVLCFRKVWNLDLKHFWENERNLATQKNPKKQNIVFE